MFFLQIGQEIYLKLKAKELQLEQDLQQQQNLENASPSVNPPPQLS